jgi:tetratricopeptide (TPR) repeat protein
MEKLRARRVSEVLVVLALCVAAAGAQTDVDPIWNDPTFKRQFIGSYGINAEIEPRVTEEEVELLEELRPLMASDLVRAEKKLASEITPDSSAMLDFTLAGIQYQQDRMDEALRNYQLAVAKFPSFRRAWRNLGLVNAFQGKYEEAIRAFTRMIELGGGDGYAYGLLGFAHFSREDYQPAEAAYRLALLLQPESTEWRLGLTRCVFKQKKFEDAAALLDALIARYPDKADFWWLQAQTYLEMKQPLKAAENLESLARIGLATLESQYALGDIYASENLMELALRAYEGAIDLDLKQPLQRPLRSVEVLAARGAHAQARAICQKIRRIEGEAIAEADYRRLLKIEARCSMAEGTSTAQTADVLEEIVQLDPLDGEALIMLGQHYLRQGEPERAILYLERAENVEASEVKARIHHAQVLVGMGRHAEAVPHLRRAQELEPREEIARYLEQVERISRARR